MCHRMFCHCPKTKNVLKKGLTAMFTLNEMYQTVATGGLCAATCSTLALAMGHEMPFWLILLITYAAGSLSLLITKWRAMNIEAVCNDVNENIIMQV